MLNTRYKGIIFTERKNNDIFPYIFALWDYIFVFTIEISLILV